MLASQRGLFEMPRDICYLNSASYSPLPLRTQEAAREAVGRKGAPWMLDADFANRQHERARGAAARLINADASDVALISSVSYGVATAGKILVDPRGTRVLVLENDHSSPVLEWQTRAARAGFTVETGAPADRRRLDLGGARRDRAAGRAAARACLDLLGALVGWRHDRRRRRSARR